jgi:2-oxo-4-hydroxy-4-carboxy-5-ureidoimidazoline decarboxylase
MLRFLKRLTVPPSIDGTGVRVTSSPATAPSTLTLMEFNTLPALDCQQLLHSCLDVDSWAESIAGARPFPSVEAVVAESNSAGSRISQREILGALDRHPRIGGRLDDGSRESSWSRHEQSRVLGDTDADVTAELAAANTVYELHFGFIFLVCAAGRSAPELLEVLRQRLANDPDHELDVVRQELLAIAGGRIRSAVTP